MNYDTFTGLAQALFEESSDSLLLLDASNEYILDANAATQRLSGFSVRDLIAAPVSKMFQTKEAPGLRRLPPGARRVHRPFAHRRCQLRSVNPDGWLPVDVTLTRLDVKPNSLVLLKLRDARTSAFKRPEIAKRLRRLVHGVSACLWSAEVRDRDEVRFHYRTSVVESLTGRPARFFGKDLQRWREIIHPDDRAQWQLVWQRLRAGESSDAEYRVIWPDDSIHWIRENVRVAAQGDNRSLCLYGVVSDITLTKQLQGRAVPINAAKHRRDHIV